MGAQLPAFTLSLEPTLAEPLMVGVGALVSLRAGATSVVAFEVMAVVADSGFAQQVARMLEMDLQHSRRTSAADLRARGPAFRWAVRAARLFDPIL